MVVKEFLVAANKSPVDHTKEDHLLDILENAVIGSLAER